MPGNQEYLSDPLRQSKQSEDDQIGNEIGLGIEGNFSFKISRKSRPRKKSELVSSSKTKRAKSQPQTLEIGDKLPSLVIEPRSKLSVKEKNLKTGLILPSLPVTRAENPLSRPGSVDSRKSDPNIVTQCAIVDGLKDDNLKFQNAAKAISKVATAGQAFSGAIAPPPPRPR